jgi:hypothetical protein
MPRKNKAGGKPPQGPGPPPSAEAIRKAFEAAQRDIARASGLSPEQLRRLEKEIRRHQELRNAAYPPQLKQQFEAMEREQRAKRAAEAEAAALEAIRQARRARRKGIGGAPRAIPKDRVNAARADLRRALRNGDCKKPLEHVRNFFEKQKFPCPSNSTLRRHVILPVMGKTR